MFGQLTNLVADAPAWAYATVLLFAVIDALLPLVPSETVIITAGVLAASGHLSLPLVIVAGAAGAFLGDNIAYAIGRHYGGRAVDRFVRTDKGKRRAGAVTRQLDRRGGELIVLARFIPGGRTVVTLTAGLAHLAWTVFARYDAIAAAVWAAYGGLLGYVGGQAFEREAWKGVLLAIGIAFAVTLGSEAIRYARRRRRQGETPSRPDTTPQVPQSAGKE